MPAAAAMTPQARSVVIGDAGHVPFLGAVEQVGDEIEAFAEAIGAATSGPSSRAAVVARSVVPAADTAIQ